jgi:hypothetical protein
MKKHTPSFPVGTAFLLTIFATLCLLVFSVLSISSAVAEKRLSDRAAESVFAYYEADSEAEEIFARLRSGKLPENVTEENGQYSYSVAITDTLTLEVTVRWEENGTWTVLRWAPQSSNR